MRFLFMRKKMFCLIIILFIQIFVIVKQSNGEKCSLAPYAWGYLEGLT